MIRQWQFLVVGIVVSLLLAAPVMAQKGADKGKEVTEEFEPQEEQDDPGVLVELPTFTVYTDTVSGFTILYPETWSYQEDDFSGFLVFLSDDDFDSPISAGILQYSYPSAEDAAAANEAAIAEILADAPDDITANLEPESAGTLGAYDALVTGFAEEDLDGVTYNNQIYVATPVEGRSYVFVSRVVADEEETATPIFETMIESFQIITPTEVITPTETFTSEGVIFADDFTNPDTGLGHYETGDGWSAYYEDLAGYYTVELDSDAYFDDYYLGYTLPEEFAISVLGDFFGSQDSGYGITFQVMPDDPNLRYEFLISGDGFYGAYRADNADTYTTLIDWTESDFVVQGGAYNDISVIGEGSTYSLYINGEFVDSFTDDSYSGGSFGLIAENYDLEQPTTAYFDDLVVVSDITGVEPITTVEVSEVEATTTTTILADDFSDPLSGLYDFDDYSDWGIAYYDVAVNGDGYYIVELLPESGLIYDYYVDIVLPDVFTMSIDAASDGAVDNGFGLAFQINPFTDQYYRFLISGDGFYKASRVDSFNEEVDLIEWTSSDLILLGNEAYNNIGVVADNGEYTLSINGEVVDSFVDTTYSEGTAGIAGSNYDLNETIIYFDNYTITGDVAIVTPDVEVTTLNFFDDYSDTSSGLFNLDEYEDWGSYYYDVLEGDGYYTIELFPYEGPIYDYYAANTLPSNFAISVDATYGGAADNGYGLAFQIDPSTDQYYRFMISGDGFYTVDRFDSTDEFEELIPWTASDLILLDGSYNSISVIGIDSTYDLYINGEYVDSFTDDTYTDGYFGVLGDNFDVDNDTYLYFDNYSAVSQE